MRITTTAVTAAPAARGGQFLSRLAWTAAGAPERFSWRGLATRHAQLHKRTNFSLACSARSTGVPSMGFARVGLGALVTRPTPLRPCGRTSITR